MSNSYLNTVSNFLILNNSKSHVTYQNNVFLLSNPLSRYALRQMKQLILKC